MNLLTFIETIRQDLFTFLEKEGELPPHVFGYVNGKVNVVSAVDRDDIKRKIEAFRKMKADWIVVVCLAKAKVYKNLKNYKYGQINKDPTAKEYLIILGTERGGRVISEMHEVVELESGRYMITGRKEELEKVEGFLVPEPW